MEDHPENPPILDTGATHCLLPITWLGAEECEKAKRIHVKVATGTMLHHLSLLFATQAKSMCCCKCGASPPSGVQEGAARDPQCHSRLYCQRRAVEHPQVECSSEQDPG